MNCGAVVEHWCHLQPNPPSPKGEVHVAVRENLLFFCFQLGLLRPHPHAQGPSGTVPPQCMLPVAPSCPHTLGLRHCHVEWELREWSLAERVCHHCGCKGKTTVLC